MAAGYDDMVEWPPEHEATASRATNGIPLSPMSRGPPTVVGYQNGQNGHPVGQEGAGPVSVPAGTHVNAAPAENVDPRHDPVQVVPLPNAPLPRPLDAFDVAAFIINKMIGTGIFTAPVTVLIKTHNDKGLAFGLWVLGFVYTLISMTIYLEYARKLPHTGGELIYLDEIFKRPRLFAYTVYTFYFVLLYNTATNGMQFASQIMTSANPVSRETGPYPSPGTPPPGTPLYIPYDPDQRVLRLIAVAGLSLFCLIHYFSARAGRALNKALAFMKIILLVVVFIAGARWSSAGGRTESWSADNSNISVDYKSSKAADSVAAFLLIVFSFTGWENATFVSGEVANHDILRQGFIGAVCTVGVLYLLINFVFLLTIPSIEVLKIPGGAYVPEFFGGTSEARVAWAILVAISASGSLLALIYTCARVKQAIGMSNVIPWSRIWAANSPIRSQVDESSPQGGLILHWLCSVLLIVVSSAISDISEAISFPGNLQAYASGWIGAFIAIGFTLFSPSRIPDPAPAREWLISDDIGRTPIPSVWITSRYVRWTLGLFSLAINSYIVIVRLLSWKNDEKWDSANQVLQPAAVQGWMFLAIVGPIYGFAILYYFTALYSSWFTVVKIIGAEPVKNENQTHHNRYGYKRFISIDFTTETRRSYLYWLFGGSQQQHIPRIDIWDLIRNRVEQLKQVLA